MDIIKKYKVVFITIVIVSAILAMLPILGIAVFSRTTSITEEKNVIEESVDIDIN